MKASEIKTGALYTDGRQSYCVTWMSGTYGAPGYVDYVEVGVKDAKSRSKGLEAFARRMEREVPPPKAE